MIWATIAASVLAWVRVNYQGLVLGALLGAGLLALKGAVSPPAPVAALSTAGAAQSLSGTASAHSGGTITVPGRPAMPCPPDKVCPQIDDLVIRYDCDAKIAGAVAQAVSAAARVDLGHPGIPMALAAGFGYHSDNSVDLRASFRAGRLVLDAAANSSLAYQVGASWVLLER